MLNKFAGMQQMIKKMGKFQKKMALDGRWGGGFDAAQVRALGATQDGQVKETATPRRERRSLAFHSLGDIGKPSRPRGIRDVQEPNGFRRGKR